MIAVGIFSVCAHRPPFALAGRFDREGGVRARREHQVERADRHVGQRSERARGDALRGCSSALPARSSPRLPGARARAPGRRDDAVRDEVGGSAERAREHRRARPSPCPRSRPPGHAAGSASNTRGDAGFLQRRQPRGQLLGEVDLDLPDVRLAGPGDDLHVQVGAVGFARPRVRQRRERRLERQARAVRGLERARHRGARAGRRDDRAGDRPGGAQLVGLKMKLGRSIVSSSVRMSSGMPCSIVGIPPAPHRSRSSAGRCAGRSRPSRGRRRCRDRTAPRSPARRCSARRERPGRGLSDRSSLACRPGSGR